MSALTWLFGLGALAVVFPLLFHLIRRTPKGNLPFSSLMFLRPSPPRLTRRSRLENLLLLALRMGALALIALAFMRPFFRNNVNLGLADATGRKIAVLLDTSASMRRGDLWQQAIDRVATVTKSAENRDDVAIYTFDSELNCHAPFGMNGTNGVTTDTKSRSAVQYRLDELEPSWQRSDLGSALSNLADELDQQSDEDEDPRKSQIVVISDMQSGSSTSALQSFGWPENVKVEIERVELKQSQSNASLQLLQADTSNANVLRELVLVRNAKDSTTDQFNVAWALDEAGTTSSKQAKLVPFYVPPGSSKILTVARDVDSLRSRRLVLTGDDGDFDNQFYVVPPNQLQLQVAYLANDDAEDPDEMLYYFKRCLFETPVRKVNIEQYTDEKPFGYPNGAAASSETDPANGKPDLLVITRAVTQDEQTAIDRYLAENGSVLIVLADEKTLASTQSWTDINTESKLTTVDSSKYAMLGTIDFEHPMFQPFAGPRLNDFTQIRFWQHLKSEFATGIDATQQPDVLARFDDELPAIWQPKRKEKGSVLVLATGWQPRLSQLALSSKFLPIISRLVDLSATTPQIQDAVTVGDPIELPDEYLSANVQCDARSFKLDPELSVTEQFASPGVYQLSIEDDSSATGDADNIAIAVNLDPAESVTDAMPLEQLTAYGVQLGTHVDAATDINQQRKLQDQEMENRQRLWKWLILAALALLIGETWLAGKTDRQSRAAELATN